MLPAVLACYEWWLGERRWKRLVPFLLVSLSFGLQGLLLNPSQDHDYAFRFGLPALWRPALLHGAVRDRAVGGAGGTGGAAPRGAGPAGLLRGGGVCPDAGAHAAPAGARAGRLPVRVDARRRGGPGGGGRAAAAPVGGGLPGSVAAVELHPFAGVPAGRSRRGRRKPRLRHGAGRGHPVLSRIPALPLGDGAGGAPALGHRGRATLRLRPARPATALRERVSRPPGSLGVARCRAAQLGPGNRQAVRAAERGRPAAIPSDARGRAALAPGGRLVSPGWGLPLDPGPRLRAPGKRGTGPVPAQAWRRRGPAAERPSPASRRVPGRRPPPSGGRLAPGPAGPVRVELRVPAEYHLPGAEGELGIAVVGLGFRPGP